MLLNHPEHDGPATRGEFSVSTVRNPELPDLKLEWRVDTRGSDNLNGRVARTLHPTKDGHQGMGNAVKEALKKHYRPD
jgi:lysophospholipase L1-like esterase